MVRQQVYGKKPTRAAFVASNIFAESSPSKSASRPSTRDENSDNDVFQASKALDSLRIQDDDDSSPVQPPRRLPLSTRDGNRRQQEKKGMRVPKKEIKSKEGKKQTIQDVTVPAVEILPLKEENPAVSTKHRHMAHPKRTLLSPRSRSPIPQYNIYDPYIQPLVALTNEQKAPIQFSAWSADLTPHFSISKIAEASYSEVYRLSLRSAHPTLSKSDESVLKLIALKPAPSGAPKTKAQEKREGNMSSVVDVSSEVRLLKRMTEIPGFTNYRALHVLEGRPCKAIVEAWKAWNKSKPKGAKSEFPDPSRKANYEETQYWAVIEMQDAGTDVEKLLEDKADTDTVDLGEEETSIDSIWATWDIFWQVVLAVAKGEREARFEHRDLHLGNICVRRKGDGEKILLSEDVDDEDKRLGFTNLDPTIIDYTLSRAEMPTIRKPQSSHSEDTVNSASSSQCDMEDAEVAYNPLENQPDIFTGDAEADYQYEIYRCMRDLITTVSPDKEEDWRTFNPRTNLLWLHFVLWKLCESVRWPSEDYSHGDERRRGKARELEIVLREVSEVLAVERVLDVQGEGIGSAVELVALAVLEGWLGEVDINS